MSADEESYEEHVCQNNTRLVSIATNLREPTNFASACSELTQWCSDPRAFTVQFEDNLLSALQIAVENGTKDGFDFALAHQLITCCFQHRKLLSKESAVRINRWYEQYRRIKKNGGKRKRKPDMPPVDPGGLEQITVTDSGCTSSMWPQGGPMAGAAQMTSPGYPGAMPMMPGYPGMPQQTGPFPPMDPTGARAAGFPEGYDQQQQAAMLRHQHLMQMQHMQRHQQRQAMNAQGYPEGMYPIPMGANSVPGQTQPLLRMPSHPGQAAGYPAAMMAGRGAPLMSPAYPQGSNHQMIKASPPVLFSNLQHQPQSQPVMSYPNPHAMPPPYGSQEPVPYVIVPRKNHLVHPFTPPDGQHQYSTAFSVPQDEYAQLGSSQVYELQLKAYVQEETHMNRTCWPTKPGTVELAIQIMINGHRVPIHKDRSALVKQFIKPGENKLEIQTVPLPYKYYYQIQPVTLMPLSRFNEYILGSQAQKNINADHFKQKLMAKGNGNTVVVPLLDGKTGRKLRMPARCTRCQHSSCFELYETVLPQMECSNMMCPVPGCSLTFPLSELEVDIFVGEIIQKCHSNNNSSAIEVILEQNGCYRLSDGAPEPVVRKRPSNDDANNVQSLKRIKSEQFPAAQPSSSPFPTVNSVPGGMPLGQSPADLMSPFGSNISPKKEIMSPPVGVGAGTPQPPVKEESQPLPGTSTLTSPHGSHPIVNNGSVDSVNGSAPYTPASMNGTSSTTQTQQQQVEAQNISLTTLENEIVEPFRPEAFGVHSPIEICKYLLDGDIRSGCHKYELNDQTLTDMQDILNREALSKWGLSLKEIERQLPPLLLPCRNN